MPRATIKVEHAIETGCVTRSSTLNVTLDPASTRDTATLAKVKKEEDAVKVEATIKTEGPGPMLSGLRKRKRRDPVTVQYEKVQVPKAVPKAFQPPATWTTTYATIQHMRSLQRAPVDDMTNENPDTANYTPAETRLHTLVSLIISSQTKDTVNLKVMQGLKAWGLTVQSLLDVDPAELNERIRLVGFHNRKTIYLKETAKILRDQWQDDIPNTLEGLLALPGTGPKMAHLALQSAFGKFEGIGVDTHVHRISSRLKWVPAGTEAKGAEATRAALEGWLPKEKWGDINKMLVGFGQTICTPLRPKCQECMLARDCPASSVKRSMIALEKAAERLSKEETC